ncbi:MAG: hypothetical protein WBP93_00180 [Pyrinomonadaceae bacterium]
MKKLLSASLLCGFLLLTALVANAQNATASFDTKKKNGYTLSVAFTVKNGEVKSISVDEWTPINRSFHERGIEAERGDDNSTWTDNGDTTTIESDGLSVKITRRGNGYLVETDWSGAKVLFTRVGTKYFGKMLR